MGLGVDSSIIRNGIDFVSITPNFSNGIFWGLLQLLNELVHNIHENNLDEAQSVSSLSNGVIGTCLKARLIQLLGYKTAANVPPSEMNSFETHVGLSELAFTISVW